MCAVGIVAVMALPDLKFAPAAARALTEAGVREIRQRMSAGGQCPRCQEPFAGHDVAASVRVEEDRAFALAYHADCRPATVIAAGVPLAAPEDLFSCTIRTALLPMTYLSESGAGHLLAPWVVIHPSHELTTLCLQPGGRWRSGDLDMFEADGFTRGPLVPPVGGPTMDTSCELFMDAVILHGPGRHAWSAECTASYREKVRRHGGVVGCVSTGWDPADGAGQDDATTWFAKNDLATAWYPLTAEI